MCHAIFKDLLLEIKWIYDEFYLGDVSLVQQPKAFKLGKCAVGVDVEFEKVDFI